MAGCELFYINSLFLYTFKFSIFIINLKLQSENMHSCFTFLIYELNVVLELFLFKFSIPYLFFFNVSHCFIFQNNFFFIQNITDAMSIICEILTDDPEGGPARISFQLFQALYRFLAEVDGEISNQQITDVLNHLQYDVWVMFWILLKLHALNYKFYALIYSIRKQVLKMTLLGLS